MDQFYLAMAETLAQLFSNAVQLGYPSEEFCMQFCNSDVAYHYGSVYAGVQFAGIKYLQEELYDEINLQPTADGTLIASEDVMHWVGYIYAYWNRMTSESYPEIYKQAPYLVMNLSYAGFHCMDPSEAVVRLKEAYKSHH